MNVLSLFDGISCGKVALNRARFRIDKYYSSEIDKFAIRISRANHPEIIQLGDIADRKKWRLPKIDLLLGGSPCQGFSIAGNRLNFDDPRSRLFFDFVDVLKKRKPRNFIFENVASMSREIKDEISRLLRVEPILINSALVSAQNRRRLYWTDIPGVEQPEDRGILLKDILEFETFCDRKKALAFVRNYENAAVSISGFKYYIEKKKHQLVFSPLNQELSARAYDYMFRKTSKDRNHWDFGHHSDAGKEKSACVTANFSRGVPYNVIRLGECLPGGIGNRVYSIYGKSIALTHSSGGRAGPGNALISDNRIYARQLTPREAEILQTLEPGYTDHVSKTQRFRAIGNGWTVDVIAHILSYL